MEKYTIWNKTDTIYTPVGEALTPEQWTSRYGWMNNPAAIPVIAAGIINGAFCGELHQMQQAYENMGADFSDCTTDEEKLVVIEAFENAMNTAAPEPSAEERIAAALEYQNLTNMPNV